MLAVDLEGDGGVRRVRIAVEAEAAFGAGRAACLGWAGDDLGCRSGEGVRLVALRELWDHDHAGVAALAGLFNLAPALDGGEDRDRLAPRAPGDLPPEVGVGPHLWVPEIPPVRFRKFWPVE